MRVKEEIAEAQRRFGLLSFYDKFEHIVILVLTALIAVIIVFAIWNLALKIFLSIASNVRSCLLSASEKRGGLGDVTSTHQLREGVLTLRSCVRR